MSNANLKQLEQIAVGMDVVEEKFHALSSNIGDIGIAVDQSNAELRNPLQNDFPLVNWLLSTPASARLRGKSGLAYPHKNEDGEWSMLLPTTVGTLPPQDTSGACCWVPLDIAKCNSSMILKMLCLKDCDNIFDNLVNMNRRPSGGDLTSYFQREGETVKDARTRMARLSMAYLTGRTMILGVPDAGTDVLKPFPGLLSVVENDAVMDIDGSNVLGGFDTLWCRIKVLELKNPVIAVHPLTYEGISEAVQPGRFNALPSGWARSGDTITFHGIKFIQDKLVPVDLTTGTGEAWVLDGNTVGAYMATTLMPTDNYIWRGQMSTTDDPAQGCATLCDYYYNYGGVFGTDANRAAVITNIPISANCLGTTLQGLDDLVIPNTLVPMV